MLNLTPEQDYVLSTVESRDVHFVRLWFVDVLGNLKSLAIVTNELERAFDIGIPIDGNCVAGFGSKNERDIIAWPLAQTFQILPWRPDEKCVARMFCELKNPDGTMFESSSRAILTKAMKKADELGYLVNIKPEIEYFYFKDESAPAVLDEATTFDLTCRDAASDLRRDTVITLENMGIPIANSHHEIGHSQHEIDLRTMDAMATADSIMTYKVAVKEIAQAHGVYASFMPKPITDQPGNSMHMYFHLVDEQENNAFFDKSDKSEYNLSPIAKHFMAGVLKHAREFCMLTNQYQNSYKRLVGQDCLSNHIAWSRRNKYTLLRVPGSRPGMEESSRVELRCPDPACNPYLAISAVIFAGLDGIENKLELEKPTEETTLITTNCPKLPYHLGEAIEEFENSELMKKVLGERIHEYLVKVKQNEWRRAISRVTEIEINDFLAVL